VKGKKGGSKLRKSKDIVASGEESQVTQPKNREKKKGRELTSRAESRETIDWGGETFLRIMGAKRREIRNVTWLLQIGASGLPREKSVGRSVLQDGAKEAKRGEEDMMRDDLKWLEGHIRTSAV